MTYKPLTDYLNQKWTFLVEQTDDPLEPWTVRVLELPGCKTHGNDRMNAFLGIEEAIASYIQSLMEDGEAVPEPVSPEAFKGQISYRTRPDKHYRLAREAQIQGISINKLIDTAVDRYLVGQ